MSSYIRRNREPCTRSLNTLKQLDGSDRSEFGIPRIALANTQPFPPTHPVFHPLRPSSWKFLEWVDRCHLWATHIRPASLSYPHQRWSQVLKGNLPITQPHLISSRALGYTTTTPYWRGRDAKCPRGSALLCRESGTGGERCGSGTGLFFFFFFFFSFRE
jgi:hypothetical protein